MVSPPKASKEVSLHMTVSDARLIVAALYTAQAVETLGLSIAQANRAGIIISAIHGAIFRALRQSRADDLS